MPETLAAALQELESTREALHTARQALAAATHELEGSRFVVRQTRDEAKEILELSTDAFLGMDRNWRCVYANPAAHRIFGTEARKLVGGNILKAIPGFAGSALEGGFEQCLADNRARTFDVFREENDAWYECRCHPSPEGLSAMLTDITDWKRESLITESTGERVARAIGQSEGGFWDMELDPHHQGGLAEKCYFSPRLKTLLGYQEAELPNRLSAWLERVHPEDAPSLRKAMLDHLQGLTGHFDFEYRIRASSGVYHWFHSRGNVLRDGHGNLIRWTAVTLDVTDKKQDEERHARLAAIIESSRDAIIAQSRAGKIVSWNPGAERMYGYRAAETHGKMLADLILPENSWEQFQEIIRKSESSDPFAPIEIVAAHKDGHPIDVLITLSPLRDREGRLTGYSSIHTDITQKKRMELKTRRLNHTLTSVLRALPDIVWVTRGDHTIQFLNPAAEKFFDRIGSAAALPASMREEIEMALMSGRDQLPTDFRGVHSVRITDETRHFLCRLVAMKDEHDKPFGLTVMLQDVTDFRLLDEIKTNLIGTVSHELKTPVTSIRMSLLLLLEEQIGRLNDSQRELASVARDEIERLLRTLNTLLDLTRFEEGRHRLIRRRVAVQSLLDGALGEVGALAAAAKVRLKCDLAPGVTEVEADADCIVHVLTNLLTNAIKHSPPEATAQITVGNHDARRLRFAVTDRGPGIPREHQMRLFEKFYKVPGNEKSGTGLGLAIVREFVRAHGGDIGVNSEPGRGSEFYFILPKTAPRKETAAETAE